MAHKTSYKSILSFILCKNKASLLLSDFDVNEYGEPPVYGAILVFRAPL